MAIADGLVASRVVIGARLKAFEIFDQADGCGVDVWCAAGASTSAAVGAALDVARAGTETGCAGGC